MFQSFLQRKLNTSCQVLKCKYLMLHFIGEKTVEEEALIIHNLYFTRTYAWRNWCLYVLKVHFELKIENKITRCTNLSCRHASCRLHFRIYRALAVSSTISSVHGHLAEKYIKKIVMESNLETSGAGIMITPSCGFIKKTA